MSSKHVIQIALLSIFVILISFIFYIPHTYNYEEDQQTHQLLNISSIRYSSKCACDRSDVKILNLGFPKSGTGTLHQLLLDMGCVSLHWSVRNISQINITNLRLAGHESFIDNMIKHHVQGLAKLIKYAEQDKKPLLYYFSNTVNAISQMDNCHNYFCYWPQLIHYIELYQQYPNSLFILMKRNITKHLISINNWNNMRLRFIEQDIPYLPKGKGKTDKELTQWIQDHYRNVSLYFRQQSDARFLVFDIEQDSVEILQDFFGCYGNYTLGHVHWTNKTNASVN